MKYTLTFSVEDGRDAQLIQDLAGRLGYATNLECNEDWRTHIYLSTTGIPHELLVEFHPYTDEMPEHTYFRFDQRIQQIKWIREQMHNYNPAIRVGLKDCKDFLDKFVKENF